VALRCCFLYVAELVDGLTTCRLCSPPTPAGVVCDYGLTLSDLIGVLQEVRCSVQCSAFRRLHQLVVAGCFSCSRTPCCPCSYATLQLRYLVVYTKRVFFICLPRCPQFFDRLGLSKLRFKPAFNPYTEPSMEIFRQALFCSINQLWSSGCMRRDVHPSLPWSSAGKLACLTRLLSTGTVAARWTCYLHANADLLSCPTPSPAATRSSWASGSRWATAACSAPKCCGPWACRRA